MAKKIGYVPQNVSIIDAGILFNIVLEDDPNKIDLIRVDELLKQVNLYEHVYNLPKRINELAGESELNYRRTKTKSCHNKGLI